MVEMVETANILHHATNRSLLILDEIGRGTSTYDGVSIAWAVVEYIHNHPSLRAKTLFATHYHELTQLSDLLPGVRNYNVAVNESWGSGGISPQNHTRWSRPILWHPCGAAGWSAHPRGAKSGANLTPVGEILWKGNQN